VASSARIACTELTKLGETMGTFEVYRDRSGNYRWRLRAGNGEIIASSEGYSSRQSCLKGIAAVKKDAPKAKVVKA
jgi:hypothetical protein